MSFEKMNFQNAMENFAEAWVVANRQNNSYSTDQHLLPLRDVRDTRQDESAPHSSKQSTPFVLPAQQQQQPTMSSAHYSAAVVVRSLPIRCTVQRGDGDLSAAQSSSSTVLVRDSFAILPGSMLLKDIVKASLLKLGFPPAESIGAKGYIEIRNWKPLSLTSITRESGCTIEQILGDIISVSTLIICLNKKSRLALGISSQSQSLSSPSGPSYATLYTVPKLKGIPLDEVEWTDEAVRAAVFQLLKEVSQTTLAKISPLPQSMISNIVNSKYMATISMGTCHDFGLWYRQYRKEHEEPHNGSEVKLNSRQTFHSVYELPLMRSWLQDCPNPTEDTLKQYLNELNASIIRQERGPITLQRLKLWWRNEKLRSERRASIAKLHDATTDSTHLLECGTNPDGTPVRRPRKPRRRKPKYPTQMLSGEADNVMSWDEGRVSYGSRDSSGNTGGISYMGTNGSSVVDGRKESFDISVRANDVYEQGRNGEIDAGVISGRSETSLTNVGGSGRSPSCNSDVIELNRRNIQSSRGGGAMDYSPGHCTDRDIASVTHAAICSSIPTYDNMTEGGSAAVEEAGSGGVMYSLQPSTNSPSRDPSHHHAIPLSLIRTSWN